MKKLIVANWKMNPQTLKEARVLMHSVEHRAHTLLNTEIVVCPPTLFISALGHSIGHVSLGVQNAMWEDQGAFTGELSPAALKEFEIKYALVGHSERRIHFGETDEQVGLKVGNLLKHKITPIVCLGGGEKVTRATTKRTVTRQLSMAIKDLQKEEVNKIVFAYEPTWAISSIKNSEPAKEENVVEMVDHIRDLVAKETTKSIAEAVKVLYGGTVNSFNVNIFARHSQISGALVGSASLDPDNFWEVIKEFERESIHNP